jgi:hypothetical protein
MAPTSTWRTIRFSKPGAQPPVYLVGSFSSPPWDPTEMQYTIKDGEYEFRKEIEVEAGQRYQYKIRIGESEWALNENEDKGKSPTSIWFHPMGVCITITILTLAIGRH